MKRYFAIIILLTLSLAGFAQVKQTVTKSSVTFQIKNLGLNTTGSFGSLKADIQFDPANPGTSSIIASIDVNSINTDNDTRDEHLKSDSYFDAAKFPAINMKLISLKHKSGNNYSGLFNLTIKDKTNVVEVPFTYIETGNSGEFKGGFKIKRTDYDVGGSSMIMSNDVTLTIDVVTGKN